MYIKALWEFEQKEKKVRSKESRIKEIGRELQIKNKIEEAKREIEEIQSTKEGFLQRKKELEIENDENKDQLLHISSLIKSNKLKTSKELKTAKKTEESLKLKQEELKKNLEFVTSEIKEKDNLIEELNKKISEMEKTIAEIKEKRQKLKKELKLEVEALKKDFDKLKQTVPEPIIRKYETIKESYPEGAIATVDHGFCGNCGVQLPLEVLEELEKGKGDRIIQCEVCGKILYFPEMLK